MASSLPPLFIVFNAASGSADSDRAMARVHELLNAAGQPHEILAVRGNDDLTRTPCAPCTPPAKRTAAWSPPAATAR